MLIPIEDMRYIKTIQALTGLFFLFSSAVSQVTFPLIKLQTTKPFTFSEIPDIIQDSYGFLWIASDEGLYRFDGKTCLYLGAERNRPNALQHPYVKKLFIDRNNTLWVGTFFGLHKFDYCNNTFKHYHPDEGKIRDRYINDIEPDSSGNIWIATYRGLIRMSLSDESTETFDNNNSNLPTRDFTCLFFLPNGTLLMGTKNYGVWQFKDKTFSPYSDKSTYNFTILDLLVDKDSALWIATEQQGVLKIDRDGRHESFLRGTKITTLEVWGDNQDIIFGGKIWKRNKKQLLDIRLECSNDIQPRAWLRSFKSDQKQTYIFSNNGIYLLNDKPTFEIFHSLKYPKNNYGLSSVTAIEFKNDSIIYFKINELGLYLINLKNGTLSPLYQTTFSWEYKNPVVKYHHLFFYCDSRGIMSYNTISRKSNLVKKGEYRFCFIDGNTLNLIPQTDMFHSIEQIDLLSDKEAEQKIVYKGILPRIGIVGYRMTEDSTRWLFFVEGETAISGLLRKRKTDTAFTFMGKSNTDYSNLFINDVCVAPNGQILVATESGLSVCDTVSKTITPYALKTNKSYGIKALISDGVSKVYFSTIEGIFSLDVLNKNALRHYTINEGLNDDVFFLRSAGKDFQQRIFLGNNKGIIFFKPSLIDKETHPHPLRIVSLTAWSDKNPQHYFFPAYCNKHTQLPVETDKIEIDYTAPYFGSTGTFSYRFKIKETDSDWTYAQSPAVLSTAKLPRGKQLHFVVQQLDDNNQVLSESEVSFRIGKRNYSVFFFALAGLVFLMMLIFRKKLKKANPILKKANYFSGDFLQQVNQIIETNLDNSDLNSALIEQQMAVSRTKLFRKMKDCTGMSITAYIRDYRITRAYEMLTTKKYTTSEIIYKVGFNSRSYFYRCFKEKYGANPTELFD